MYGSSDTGSWGRTYGGVISSVLNAIQIQILNTAYKKMAVALNGTTVLPTFTQREYHLHHTIKDVLS